MHKDQSNIGQEPVKAPVIVLTGGGSGGHITPLLAVGEEIKKINPDAKLIFIGQKGEKLKDAVSKSGQIDSVYGVRAGKFRRYHGEGLKQLLDVKTLLKNIRDFFYFIAGFFQSYKLLKKLNPDVIFIKGGYVGVPVGLAAAMHKIPYVTHDSDALPGLANRIIGRWAAAHAVALPKEVYKYPPNKTFTVGVPISNKYKNVGTEQLAAFKRQLKLKASDKVLFVTGGGNGAERLNEAVVKASVRLLTNNPNLHIIHGTGQDGLGSTNKLYGELLEKADLKRVSTTGFFVNDLYVHSGAADIIISRAGATAIAEFAAQHKACIIIPNPALTGGHQLKNAQYLANQKAAILLDDAKMTADYNLLTDAVEELLSNPTKRAVLGKNLGKFAKLRASKDLAELILDTIT